MRYTLLLFVLLLAGCSAKKVVVKNCQYTASSELWVCEEL